MKFSEFKYKRPDTAELQTKYTALLEQFRNAPSFNEQKKALHEINSLRNEYSSMNAIAFINYTIDTRNKAYGEEQAFYDKNDPVLSKFDMQYFKELVNSKFRNEIDDNYGKHLSAIAEITMKTFSPGIMEDLQKENSLNSEYYVLSGSARVIFEGKEMNLQELRLFMQLEDRELRKKANEAFWKFYSDNGKEFDRIYDELVKLRDKMAKKLGFKNFIEPGYARMKRTDYTPEMLTGFRKEVIEHVVPLCMKLREKQRKRLGVEKLKYYDLNIQFKSGNALPKGPPEWIVENAKKMYSELSPETEEFFNYMADNELMDVYSRKGKADMGFCNYIPSYKSPYIFSNMNGTEADITILTHEAGHAFQAYTNRDRDFKEYFEPTADSAEVHSMSMEFFTWPWMNLFFKEDTDKFKFTHLNSALSLIPSVTLGDHFQHIIYENPSLTPEERNSAWRELEKIYTPWVDYDDNEYLERGGAWQRHIPFYQLPFYLIDYALAQICAFQFWQKAIYSNSTAVFQNAFNDYLTFCRAGGSKPFLELVKNANLLSPFTPGTVESVTKDIGAFLDTIDDAKLD